MTEICIYHANCPDGLVSAWIVKTKYPNVEFIGMNYGRPLLDIKDKSIIVVDFSLEPDILEELAKINKEIITLDHHKSAIDKYKNITTPLNTTQIFDLSRCGAEITWDFFYPEKEKQYPWFINMVADRDLWRWSYEWSKDVSTGCFEENLLRTIDNIETLSKIEFESPEYNRLYEKGKESNLFKKNIIDVCCKNISWAELKHGDKTYKVIMCSDMWQYRSELGNELADRYLNKADFCVIYKYNLENDEWHLAFRRSTRSNIDLSLITKSIFPVGGGHPGASGATIYGLHSNPLPENEHKRGETLRTYFTHCLKPE